MTELKIILDNVDDICEKFEMEGLHTHPTYKQFKRLFTELSKVVEPRHPLQQCLQDNGDLIALQATVAQQAQMIEHLRGGPTPGYTAANMTTAAADGFRDGVAKAESLRKALIECASSLEGEMLQKYHGQQPDDMHPVTRRDYERDMAEIDSYKALITKSAG